MKTSIKCILLFLAMNCIASRMAGQQRMVVMEDNLLDRYEPIYYSLNYNEVQGSAYLNDTLKRGVVRFPNGDSSEVFMRYNIYEDAIEYTEGNRLMVINNPKQIVNVFIGKTEIVYLNYRYGKSVKEGYLIKLVSGEISLYIKYRIEFEDAESPLTGYHSLTPAQFVYKPSELYISNDGFTIRNFKSSKTELMELFGTYYKEMGKFKKNKKLKLRKKEDVVVLFEYFNSLQ